MVAIRSIIHSDTPCSKSQNDFCCFRRVIWLLTRYFKLLSFFTFIFAFFSNFRIYNRYTTPFFYFHSVFIRVAGLQPNTKFNYELYRLFVKYGIVHCCCRDVYSLSMIGVYRNTVLEYFTFSKGLFWA